MSEAGTKRVTFEVLWADRLATLNCRGFYATVKGTYNIGCYDDIPKEVEDFLDLLDSYHLSYQVSILPTDSGYGCILYSKGRWGDCKVGDPATRSPTSRAVRTPGGASRWEML